jgi:hypothetical protein
MMGRLAISGLAALLAACTGRGVDRTGAVPARAALEVRPVADGDPWLRVIAAPAQDPRAAHVVEITTETVYSHRLPPIETTRIRASTKPALVELVAQAGPAPGGLAPGYEQERADRWSLLAVHVDDGLMLGPDVLVKLAWDPAQGDPSPAPQPSGVLLLLGPDDARAFERLTTEYEGCRLAILQGDEVLMAPTVNEPIGGGQIQVHPGTEGSAEELYVRLTGQPAPAHP